MSKRAKVNYGQRVRNVMGVAFSIRPGSGHMPQKRRGRLCCALGDCNVCYSLHSLARGKQ